MFFFSSAFCAVAVQTPGDASSPTTTVTTISAKGRERILIDCLLLTRRRRDTVARRGGGGARLRASEREGMCRSGAARSPAARVLDDVGVAGGEAVERARPAGHRHLGLSVVQDLEARPQERSAP